MPKVRMVNDSQGIKTGTELDVSEDRAARWCFDKKCAVFVETKDKVAVKKKVDKAKAEAEERQRKLLGEDEED